MYALTLSWAPLSAQNFISTQNEPGAFAVSSATQAATIYVDSGDYFLVHKAAELLQGDIQKVTGNKPGISNALPTSGTALIIGSLDHSSLIRQLVKKNKIQVGKLQGKWESYQIQVVTKPFKGVDKALVIVGSDRRGTAYGVFTLSKQMGVSPWYWWADVPVKKKSAVFVKEGTYFFGPPAVKYRGFFINDEAPALSGWVHEKFGDFNHQFYEKVFELLLRLRANYLWPAMWGNAFNNDDTLNPVMADKYGIVMGTSHQEPMNQATEHWRHTQKGAWDYQTNDSTLRAFWKSGIKNMDHRETIVTMGMRGDGDKPMSEKSNIALLEKIVHDQREIITKVTGKPAAQTPQDWALYKEVQDYYDKGMRVPDDVTLLFSDDNWGNIRRLPALKDSLRAGGAGIYYHFDYVGGPRNYKWINTNQISRVYEQMHLAYAYHARRIWIVNVGDIKPMELPISFFMDYAFDANRWNDQRIGEYTRRWSSQQFGDKYAGQIAGILDQYTRFNSRRKPELLSPRTYSLDHYREAERVVDSYDDLAQKARRINKLLPDAYKPAYFQLVLFPVLASANLNDLYVTAAKNKLYASQGRAGTNLLADSVKALFIRDSLLSLEYNKGMENGRWDHFMDQTHIGYTYWQQPKYNNMPRVQYIRLPDSAEMGISIQGTDAWWPQSQQEAVLPPFNSYQQQNEYIDVFSRGKKHLSFQLKADKPWIKISQASGQTDTQTRIWISMDWKAVPWGKSDGTVTITGPGGTVVPVKIQTTHPLSPQEAQINGFIESGGYVSMEAPHYTRAINAGGMQWKLIPGLGRTLAGMTAWPVTAPRRSPGATSPCLEYRMYLFDTGMVQVNTYLSPTLDFKNSGGLCYGLSVDQYNPVVINMHKDQSQRAWSKEVSNNVNITGTRLHITNPGWHTLKFWCVDPGIVLQKLVVDFGGARSSYLGPPESYHRKSGK